MRMRATVDPHSPGKYRTNGVVSNLPEFQQAFKCKTGPAHGPAESLPRLVVKRRATNERLRDDPEPSLSARGLL